MMKLKKVWSWFVKSSANPQEIALTVKGLLMGIVPVIIIIAKMNGVEIGEGELKQFIGGVEVLIVAVFGVVSAAMTVYGLLRKLWITASRAFSK